MEQDYDGEVMDFLRETANQNLIQNQLNFDMIEAIVPKRKYTVHEKLDPFKTYDEKQFTSRYRLTKNQVINLYESLDGQRTLEPLQIRDDFTIPGITKLLIALRFYAVGTFAESLSDMFGVSATTVRNTVADVSYLICLKLRNQYLQMTPAAELWKAKALFHRFAGFPLAIGAIDGTHIKVRSFGGGYAEHYRNRKGYFSLNCQIVVSANVSYFGFLNH